MEKTIKIIDLLNKIANGEKLPEKIRFEGKIFEKQDETNFYCTDFGIFEQAFVLEDLNKELEIIKEDKGIESIDVEYYKTNDERYNELLEEIASFQEWCIDKVNSLENKQ